MKLIALSVSVGPLYPFDIDDIAPVTLKEKGVVLQLFDDPLQAASQEEAFGFGFFLLECDLDIVAFGFDKENVFGIDFECLPVAV